MAEQVVNGQPFDSDPDSDAIEGKVVPFPGATPAPAKPQRGQPGELRDIIPAHLRTWQGIRKAAHWHWRRARHHSLYHAVRSPKRLVLTIWWALAGVARIAFAQLAWWWVSEQAYLRHEAIAAADSAKWLSLHKHVREVRLVRGCILGAEVVALALVAAAVTSYLPVLWIPIGLVAVPLLAWIGRPADKPIVTSAVVPGAVERLTTEVHRAGARRARHRRDEQGAARGAGQGHRDGRRADARRARLAVARRPAARRDGRGGQREARGARLRAAPPARLRVARDRPQAAPRRAQPVRRRRGHDHRRAAALAAGQARRRRPVQAAGVRARPARPGSHDHCSCSRRSSSASIPRMGKTFLLRLLLLICALDVRAETPRLRPEGHRRPGAAAHRGAPLPGRRRRRRTSSTWSPTSAALRDGDAAPHQGHPRDRREVPGALPGEQGHARAGQRQAPRPAPHRRSPWTSARSLSSTRSTAPNWRPSPPTWPSAARRSASSRCSPRSGPTRSPSRRHQRERGAADVPEGHRPGRERHGPRHSASTRPASARPCSASTTRACSTSAARACAPRIMRGQNIDGPAAKVIAARARVMRESAGRLTGYALGEDQDQEVRSFAADVLMVFGADDKLWCETIADRLRGSIPGGVRRHHQGRRSEPAARPRRRRRNRSARPARARGPDASGQPSRRPRRRPERSGDPGMRSASATRDDLRETPPGRYSRYSADRP